MKINFKYFFILISVLLLHHHAAAQQDSGGLRPSIENCQFYFNNISWLPDAFIKNATCACLVTPDETKANRIRKLLQDSLRLMPEGIREVFREKKYAFTKHQLSKRKYKRYFVHQLTPYIYHYHMQAYKTAGCTGHIAPYWQWKLAMKRSFKNKKIVWFGIRCFGGSCYGGFCKW